MKLLIVNRSVQILIRLEEIFRDTNKRTTVYIAETFDQAINQLNKNLPDAVLLDFGFPSKQLTELIINIKKVNEKTPVIVLTDRLDNHLQKQCEASGANYFVDIYYDFEKLPGLIHSIVAGKK